MRSSTPRPSSALRLGLLAFGTAFLCVACLGPGRSIQVDDGPKANPIALLFGGPLGCLVECAMRPAPEPSEALEAGAETQER